MIDDDPELGDYVWPEVTTSATTGKTSWPGLEGKEDRPVSRMFKQCKCDRPTVLYVTNRTSRDEPRCVRLTISSLLRWSRRVRCT
jgi:hypothetical protein